MLTLMISTSPNNSTALSAPRWAFHVFWPISGAPAGTCIRSAAAGTCIQSGVFLASSSCWARVLLISMSGLVRSVARRDWRSACSIRTMWEHASNAPFEEPDARRFLSQGTFPLSISVAGDGSDGLADSFGGLGYSREW